MCSEQTRRLGTFETAQALTGERMRFNVVLVVRLSSSLRADALRTAWTLLQRRHPLLRVAITRDGRGYRFVPSPDRPIPLRVVPRSSPLTWQEEAQRELEQPVEASVGPLARCALIEAPRAGETDLLITLHHAVVDASSAASLVAEVLELADASAAGSIADTVESLEPLPPVEAMYPRRIRGLRAALQTASFMCRQMVDEVSYRTRSRRSRIPPVREQGSCRVLCRRLEAEATSALVRVSRARRLTLTAVLDAALMLAVQEHLYDGKAVALRHFTFALLRPYLDPPLTEEHLGAYFSMLRFTVPLGPRARLLDVAAARTAQIQTAMRRGDKFVAPLLSATMMRAFLAQRRERMGSTALSYTGVARLPPTIGSLVVDELHAFVSNFVLGPEFTAQARMWAGCLWWDVLYLDTDMDATMAATIADHMLARLHEAASGGST